MVKTQNFFYSPDKSKSKGLFNLEDSQRIVDRMGLLSPAPEFMGGK